LSLTCSELEVCELDFYGSRGMIIGECAVGDVITMI